MRIQEGFRVRRRRRRRRLLTKGLSLPLKVDQGRKIHFKVLATSNRDRLNGVQSDLYEKLNRYIHCFCSCLPR